MTVHAFTNAEDWFSYHTTEEETEAQDQAMLEACWAGLHSAMPELGSGAEVIDSLTPRGYYDLTRRKLGMVGNPVPAGLGFWQAQPSYTTALPNLFIVSDTVSNGGLAPLSRSALSLAYRIAPLS